MSADRAERQLNALVLAAGRRGAEDSVARLQGKSHKCFVEIAGEVMLERVIRALIESECFGRIFVSIEREALLRATPQLAAWLEAGVISFIASRSTLADSILALGDSVPDATPLVITTGDNALHTPALIRDFVAGFERSTAEVAVAFTRQETVMAEYPEVGLAYHRLKDGGYSACNLYAFRSREAFRSAEVFRSGGQFGKRHWRILKSFGLMPFLLYKLRLATGPQLIARIASNLGTTIEIVMLDYAYGPIDVDNPSFFAISERILKEREGRAQDDAATHGRG
ncbi:MAG: nucleotidyltransferase family protein [Rhodothalassiaceae bacterium]